MRTFHVRYHKRDYTSGLKVVQAIDSNSAKKQFWDGMTIISRVNEVVPDKKKEKAE
jgi:hypothetical protein